MRPVGDVERAGVVARDPIAAGRTILIRMFGRRDGFCRVEGRWQYVSLDTRFPVGIMPAWSFGKEKDGKLVMQFESLAFVGLGRDVEGRMIRSNLELSRGSDDHEFVRQFWVQADGTGREWLAVEYEYKRLP
jgi:hypothetical protein